MKNYLINADFDVYEDNYTEGEQEHVNGYSINSAEIEAESPIEAVSKFYENVLSLPFDKENAYIPHKESKENDKNEIQYSNLVDKDNSEPTQAQLDLWEKDELKLYSLDAYIKVYEITPVEF